MITDEDFQPVEEADEPLFSLLSEALNVAQYSQIAAGHLWNFCVSVYIYVYQRVPLVKVKEHVIGDVKIGNKYQNISDILDFSSRCHVV